MVGQLTDSDRSFKSMLLTLLKYEDTVDSMREKDMMTPQNHFAEETRGHEAHRGFAAGYERRSLVGKCDDGTHSLLGFTGFTMLHVFPCASPNFRHRTCQVIYSPNDIPLISTD